MVIHKVTAKNIKEAGKRARNLRDSVYGGKYIITDIRYIKGSKKDALGGKGLKRYGIILRKKG